MDFLLGDLFHSLSLSLSDHFGDISCHTVKQPYGKTHIKRVSPASYHVNELGSGYPKTEPSEKTAALVDSLNADRP